MSLELTIRIIHRFSHPRSHRCPTSTLCVRSRPVKRIGQAKTRCSKLETTRRILQPSWCRSLLQTSKTELAKTCSDRAAAANKWRAGTASVCAAASWAAIWTATRRCHQRSGTEISKLFVYLKIKFSLLYFNHLNCLRRLPLASTWIRRNPSRCYHLHLTSSCFAKHVLLTSLAGQWYLWFHLNWLMRNRLDQMT